MVHPGELLCEDCLWDLEEVGEGRDDIAVVGRRRRPRRDQVRVVVVVVTRVVACRNGKILKYYNWN